MRAGKADSSSAKIAILIPCYNEELTVAKVIEDFRRTLPSSEIYVYDNNSMDRTAEIARAAGAIVRKEEVQGKGSVVRRMFADVDADVYVLVDGDATYDAQDAPLFVSKLLSENLDMVNGQRIAHAAPASCEQSLAIGSKICCPATRLSPGATQKAFLVCRGALRSRRN